MTETKTVELPLTKSEQNHLDNVRRRNKNKLHQEQRNADKQERDGKLRAISNKYDAQVKELRTKQREEVSKVWKEWTEKRSQATDSE